MKRFGIAILLAVLFFAPIAAGQSSVSVPAISDPSAAIVAVISVNVDTRSGDWFGSGFLVSPDGLVLTNAHVASHVLLEPTKYRLLVIVGTEFYSASVVCSTAGSTQGKPQRDIAVLRLAPSDFPFTSWVIAKGDPARTFQAHTGPLSQEFPTLSLADHSLVSGEPVIVRGWGSNGGHPIERIVGYGAVDRVTTLQDGTRVFSIREANAVHSVEHGVSGSAFLDQQGRVAGQLFWGIKDGSTLWATDASELRHPCGNGGPSL